MGEEMAERSGNKGNKRKETEIELDKDGKDLEKAKKKDKVDGLKDSVDSSEGRKEKKKKKRHKEGKEEGADKLEEAVVGPGNGDVSVGNGEEEQPKKHKKKKREKEDCDDLMENSADDEHKHSEVRNRVGRKGKDGGKLVVKDKNGDYVLDTVQNVVVGSEYEDRGDKSKKKKERKRGNVSDDAEEKMTGDEGGNGIKRKKKRKSENESHLVEEEVKTHEEWDESKKEKKKKKKKMDSEDVSGGIEDEVEAGEKGEKSKKKENKAEKASADVEDKTKTGTDEEGYRGEKKKKEKKKKKKKKEKDENVSTGVEVELGSDEEGDKRMKKKKKRKSENVSSDGGDTVHSKDVDKHKEDMRKKKKKKANSKEQVLNKKDVKGKARIETDTGDNPKPKRKSRKVSFSDDVEVFDDARRKPKTWKKSYADEEEASHDGLSDLQSLRERYQEKGLLIHAKRYSKEEDELIEEAVFRYIEEHNLGDDGINMVLNCSKFPQAKNCWSEICEAIPWRPLSSVYYRGHMLFERNENGKWTEEEKEYILKFYEEEGADWAKLSRTLDKHRLHCKDAWRRIRLPNMNKGSWLQDEYQTLFDLVNKDLRMRALEERIFKHGMIRDNICWEAVSTSLATRPFNSCCTKWYNQMTSPMVNQGLWADTDDYRLIAALTNLDAASLEDVDWDCLVEFREGHFCRKRWDQMVKHVGNYRNISFAEQVEVLGKRYNPDDLQAREAFDRQPLYP